MRSLLTRLLTYPVERALPTIAHVAEPIRAAGMSMPTSVRTIYRDVPNLAKRYESYKREYEIPDKKQPWAFVAVSRDFDKETGTFIYCIGDVVTTFANLPPGLEPLEIPPMAYAVIPVRPRNRLGWPFAIPAAKKYIYERWLPQSEYEPGGVIDDFEYHDERSTRPSRPEIDLYVCIRPRSNRESQAG